MKRLFVAVDISDAATQRVVEYTTELRRSFPNHRVRWERPEKLHLTLRFLGDTDESLVGPLSNALTDLAAKYRPFQMYLEETGVFPTKGDARILWIGIRSGEILSAIAHDIEEVCSSLGFKIERREFSPHLTIARLREPRSSIDVAAAHRSCHFSAIMFGVREIVLYESKLEASGSIYNKTATFPLSAN